MQTAIPAKKWLLRFLSFLLAAVFAIGLIAYWTDPFYRFRYEERSYFNNTAKFPGPGLVKNYPYDTLILGSSMTQNFDMELFRQELGARPLHIGIGGIGLEELLSYIELSEQTGKCTAYYIGIDQYMLASPQTYKTPEYLFRDDAVSTLRYLFCYEAWFRYIPLDAALSMLRGMGVELPAKLRQTTEIDYLGNWETDYTFGEAAVIHNYLNNAYGVSSVETDGLYERMTASVDTLFDSLPGDKTRYHFFFPPYSVLFWYDAQCNDYLEEYLQIKEYFCQKAQLHGICVYDFQSAECVYDLDNYRDMTHYRGQINDWMVQCFARGEWLADEAGIRREKDRLIEKTKAFGSAYHSVLSGPMDAQ